MGEQQPLTDFQLTPSPADPQPVKLFALDDYEWWAGYSLEGCIAAARAQNGAECYEGAEEDGEELTDQQMATLYFVVDPDDDSCGCDGRRSFAQELARRIAAGERFPQFFAAPEY